MINFRNINEMGIDEIDQELEIIDLWRSVVETLDQCELSNFSKNIGSLMIAKVISDHEAKPVKHWWDKEGFYVRIEHLKTKARALIAINEKGPSFTPE